MAYFQNIRKTTTAPHLSRSLQKKKDLKSLILKKDKLLKSGWNAAFKKEKRPP